MPDFPGTTTSAVTSMTWRARKAGLLKPLTPEERRARRLMGGRPVGSCGAPAPAAKAEPSPRSTRGRTTTVRPCLRCRDDFPSEGAHNRLCTRCNTAAGHVGGALDETYSLHSRVSVR